MIKYIDELPGAKGENKDRLLQEANELCALAHEQGKDEIIEWIKSNVLKKGYWSLSRFKDECIRLAAIMDNIELVEWFGKNGCSFEIALSQAIKSRSFDLCDKLLKLGIDPNCVLKYRPYRESEFIETNAIGLALAQIKNTRSENLIKIIQLFLTNGAELNKSSVHDIQNLVLSRFFDTDNKDLQILAGAELLLQLDKNPNCKVPYFSSISPMHRFSKLFIEEVKGIEKFPNEKEKIKEVLKLVSTRFRESDPELSLKAEKLAVSTQDEKNTIQAVWHLSNALSALGGSAPELSTEIEGILKKLQGQNVSPDIVKDGAAVNPTSGYHMYKVDGLHQEEAHLADLKVEEMGQESTSY